MLLCEFLPFIVGLLSGILGGLIGAAVWRNKLEPLQNNYDNSQRQVASLQQDVARQKNKVADAQQERKASADNAANWENKYNLLNKEVVALTAAKKSLDRRLKDAREADDSELVNLRQQNTALMEQIADLDTEVADLKGKVNTSRIEKIQAEENLATARSVVPEKPRKDDGGAVKDLKVEMDQLRRQAGTSAALVKQLESEKKQLTNKIVELEGDLAGVTVTPADSGAAREWETEELALKTRIKMLEAALTAEKAVNAAATRGIAADVPAEPVVEAPAPEKPKAGTKITLPSGAVIKQDDLKMVEGIGPKIEGLLHDGGIKTWDELANAPVEQVQKILDDAGPRYRMHQPTTWAKQARLAADGKWAELETYQDRLIGGREPEE